MKLTINRKLLLSYLTMAVLTVLASVYAIISLQQLSDLAYRIINDDFAVVDQSKGLLDSLIAQESAEKRYLILQDPTIEELFRARSREFNRIFEALQKGRFAGFDPNIARISLLHGQYDALFSQEVELVKAKRNDETQAISEGAARKVIDETAMLLRALQKRAEGNIDTRMKRINVQSLRASRLTVLLSLVSFVLGVLLVLLITYNISRPLRQLEQATAMIAEGKFDYDFRMDRRDEIGSLSHAFAVMAQRLKVLEERNLDASPLTGLPGNLAIERELGNRLRGKTTVSLCHVDLDNFKPFVDHYGYAWGSEVIKEVALLLMAELRESGEKEDFLGHIGGDDFVLISVPPRAEQICGRICSGFDGRIRKFYTEKDREQGFFIGKDRKGVRQKFPLISVTIAIVTDDGARFQNPLAMAEAAAQLKEYAKTLPGNNCVTEKDMRKV